MIFNRTLLSIPEEKRELLQAAEDRQNAADFEALKNGLSKGECYLCGKKDDYNLMIEIFRRYNPNLEWK
ncbi:hypothetical protein [Duncaniella sp.]|uniref:hypothetical protein n=1 Tax=Duncaniella sp. TaxID=2518496 RepID=UPI0023C060CB|nr:hypothetical protein [Duncaniella sp.]MDE5905169.1 hypothetical protein [Duncaniella sp.]